MRQNELKYAQMTLNELNWTKMNSSFNKVFTGDMTYVANLAAA